MDCLLNYIGIDGCGWIEPTAPVPEVGETPEVVFSGLYVNHLPGLSLKAVDRIANQEQNNFLTVFNNAQKRAILKLSINIRGRINARHKIEGKTVADCLICYNRAAFAPALQYLIAVELMNETLASERLNWFTINRERAEQLRLDYYAEYSAMLEDGFNSLQVKDSGCTDDCIECKGDISSFEYSLP